MTMATAINHCAHGPNGSIERGFGEKPPAETVVKACATAWNESMPGARPACPRAIRPPMTSTVRAT